MREIVIEFIGSEWFVYSMYIYLFLLLVYMVYSAMNYFKYHSRMQKTIQSLYLQMNEQEKSRAEAERQQRDIHGEGIKVDWLSKLDEELAYSGAKEKFRWLTTELYIVIVLVTAAIVTAIMTIAFGVAQGVIAAFLVVVAFKLALVLVSNARDRKIESQLLQFMNIIDNFSKTSDDLINVLEKASRYIDDPLGGKIYEAVQEARNTGDTMLAIQDLQNSVKNKHFKVLIRNLETSSRFENNYSDIIEDCRNIFHNYIKAQKEKRNIRINGVFEILIMVGTGIVSIMMIGQMTEEGNVFDVLLNNGTTGRALLAGMVAALLFSLYVAVFQIIKDK